MALRVIDTSEHQHDIDWDKAKDDIDGAIIRVGYGDDDTSQDDKYAIRNMDECERLGIPYGVYLYSHASNDAHIKSEIAHMKRMIQGRSPVSVWLDLEERKLSGTWRKAAQAWCDAFENAGIYSWQWAFEDLLSGINCKVWVAAYGSNSGKPESAYKPTINMDGWQYTSRGSVPGINGNVDVSEWYVDFSNGVTVVDKRPEKRQVLKKEVAALIMKHLCAHVGHGYTQDMQGRQGSSAEEIDIYGHKYTIKLGDRDCSSAVISAYEAAGISCGGATYTGNMRERMVGTGNFVWRPMSFIAQMGDTYLNEDNHTAMCLSSEPDILMEFSINEKGGTLGGKLGDQKQKGEYDETYGRGESHLRKYYDYPWDGILECVNNEVAFVIGDDEPVKDTQATPKQPKADTPNKASVSLSEAFTASMVVLGEYGTGKTRERKLGAKYETIQGIINEVWKDKKGLANAMAEYIVSKLK